MDRLTRETRVREAIAQAVALDINEVQLDHWVTGDLGAESLDYLDIVFLLEEAFDIEIKGGEMEGAARGDMSDEEFAPNGELSEAGLARLTELMPESAERIRPGLKSREILGLFKVRTFVNIVERKTHE